MAFVLQKTLNEIIFNTINAAKHDVNPLKRIAKEEGMKPIEDLEKVLSTIRHQLGNSVNSLKITLDVLQQNFERFDEEKRKEYLKRGSALVTRQEELIRAMKTYSKYSVREKKEIAFLDFWKDFLKTVQKKLKNEKIELIDDLKVEPCKIIGERTALNKIMMCLLENAMEAVQEIEKAKIEIGAMQSNGSVMLLMNDNGPGIRQNDIPKVFIPLFTTKKGKAGMGLSIVRKLLMEMDGIVEIESGKGEGTDVKVWLKTAEDKKSASAAC